MWNLCQLFYGECRMKAVDKKPGPNQRTGVQGEELAVAFLASKGYRIIDRNFSCKGGEIDIIARDGKTLVFVEVKTRRSLSYGVPQLAVTSFKQRQIMKASLTWLSRHRSHDTPARFDVIAIIMPDGGEAAIEHIKNAFDLSY
jgi:putative endonuclease